MILPSLIQYSTRPQPWRRSKICRCKTWSTHSSSKWWTLSFISWVWFRDDSAFPHTVQHSDLSLGRCSVPGVIRICRCKTWSTYSSSMGWDVAARSLRDVSCTTRRNVSASSWSFFFSLSLRMRTPLLQGRRMLATVLTSMPGTPKRSLAGWNKKRVHVALAHQIVIIDSRNDSVPSHFLNQWW